MDKRGSISFKTIRSAYSVTIEWEVTAIDKACCFDDFDRDEQCGLISPLSNEASGIEDSWKNTKSVSIPFSLPPPYQQENCHLVVRYTSDSDLIFLGIISRAQLHDDLKIVFTISNRGDLIEHRQEPDNFNVPNPTNPNGGYATGFGFDASFVGYRLKYRCDIVYTKRLTDSRCLAIRQSLSSGFGETIHVMMLDGQIITAHEKILTKHSVVFRNMVELYRHQYPSSTYVQILALNDVSYDVMFALVQAMYSGQLDLKNFEFASLLILAADKYHIPGILQPCEQFLCKLLTHRNVLRALEVVAEVKLYALMAACVNLLKKTDAEELIEIRRSGQCLELETNYFIKEMMCNVAGGHS